LGIILATPILIEPISWTSCFDTKKKGKKNVPFLLTSLIASTLFKIKLHEA
jgi:hypothetical protein